MRTGYLYKDVLTKEKHAKLPLVDKQTRLPVCRLFPIKLSPQRSPPSLSQQGQHISAGFHIFIQTLLSILCSLTL